MAVVGWQAIPKVETFGVAPFRSSWSRAKWAIALVAITTASLFMSAAALMSGFEIIDSVEDGQQVTFQTALWQSRLESLDGLYLLALICSAIAFFAWLSRAVDNTPALGGGTPTFTPRSSVGWWFVPFANLVQGYRIVADLWRRMALQPAEAGTPLVMGWWLLWLGGNITVNAVTRSAGPDTFDGVRLYLAIGIVASLASAASGILLVRIVWLIEQRAKARAHALSATIAEVPTAQPLPSTSLASGVPVAPGTTASTLEFCPMCGAARLDDARFCGRCGRNLVATS